MGVGWVGLPSTAQGAARVGRDLKFKVIQSPLCLVFLWTTNDLVLSLKLRWVIWAKDRVNSKR